MIGDPLGSSRVSFKKQNYEGVVGAQRGEYRVVAESSSGCGGGSGRDVTDQVIRNTFKRKLHFNPW